MPDKRLLFFEQVKQNSGQSVHVDLVDVHCPPGDGGVLLRPLEGDELSLERLRADVGVGERVVGVPRGADLRANKGERGEVDAWSWSKSELALNKL